MKGIFLIQIMSVENALCAYLSESAWLREEVVYCVAGDPDHGGEAHAESHALGPLGVRVVLAVPDRLVREDVEHEDALQSWQHRRNLMETMALEVYSEINLLVLCQLY